MSRIGKKPIIIPDGVTIQVNGLKFAAKGPHGELSRTLPAGSQLRQENGKIFVNVQTGTPKTVWGLARALVNNLLTGVSAGFTKTLEFSGVGYKAAVKGQELELNLGFSHPVKVTAPAGVSFQVEKNIIKILGNDKEQVGQVAARIRAQRPPEPYKGTGIKYADEVIIRKAGKKAVTGA